MYVFFCPTSSTTILYAYSRKRVLAFCTQQQRNYARAHLIVHVNGNTYIRLETHWSTWNRIKRSGARWRRRRTVRMSAGTSDDLLCKHLHNKKEKLPITATRKPAAAAPFRMARTLYDICKYRELLCSLMMQPHDGGLIAHRVSWDTC